MSRASRFTLRTVVPAALALALFGGCARSIFEEEPVYGSLKDGPYPSIATRPSPVQVKRVPRLLPASASVPSSAGQDASQPPLPAVRAAKAAPVPPAPPTAGSPAVPALGEVSAKLLAEGNQLFAQGDVLKARERYLAAMNGPIPEVMLAFARSFDPRYVARLERPNAGPDPQRAITIYEGAVRQGSKEAEADLERLRQAMAAGDQAAPASGEPKAAPSAAEPSAPAPTAPAAPPPPAPGGKQ